MATYRQIHISFWQDAFVLGLTPEEKYFYLYLMSNSKTTQCGIYELPKRIIEMETGYNRETVDKLLDRFVKYRKIEYCELTQEIIVINWIKHNSINSPKVKACIEKELKTVKHRAFIEVFRHLCIRYGYSINSLSKDYGEEEEKEEEKEEEQEEEKEEEKEEEQEEEKEREKEAKINVPVFDNPSNSNVETWFKKYKVEYGIKLLEDMCSFIGVVEIEVIEHCIGLSENKTAAYAINILKRFVREGKTTIEQINPKARAGVNNAESIRQGFVNEHDRPYEEQPEWQLPRKYRENAELPDVS